VCGGDGFGEWPVIVGAQGAGAGAPAGAAGGGAGAGAAEPSVVMQPLAAPIDLKLISARVRRGWVYAGGSDGGVCGRMWGYGYEPGATVTNGDGGKDDDQRTSRSVFGEGAGGHFPMWWSRLGIRVWRRDLEYQGGVWPADVERVEVPAGQVVTRCLRRMCGRRTLHPPSCPMNATGREEVTLDQFDPSSSHDWTTS